MLDQTQKSFKSPLSFMGTRINKNFVINPTTNQEVIILLLQLDDSKSSDIPIKFIKTAAPIIAPLLVNIFNLSFSKGQFPDIMNLAKMVPIFKAESTIVKC